MNVTARRRSHGRKAIGLYVIVEPAIRNALTAAAGFAALGNGLLIIGLGLILWALVDTVLKAYAGHAVLKK